mgnify:CR=1 FL=1
MADGSYKNAFHDRMEEVHILSHRLYNQGISDEMVLFISYMSDALEYVTNCYSWNSEVFITFDKEELKKRLEAIISGL